jgi:hypothetical protein
MKVAKTGAMFGLDARIALAIFGALSVISGAALYSAIKDSKATAMLTELTEVTKAWEAYLLDTGQMLPQTMTDPTKNLFYQQTTKQLVENPGVAGWSGPYVSYELNGDYINHPIYNDIGFMVLDREADWATWEDGRCTTGKKCSIWILMNGTTNASDLIKSLDEKIDDSDGQNTGKFRYKVDYAYLIYNTGIPVANPND